MKDTRVPDVRKARKIHQQGPFALHALGGGYSHCPSTSAEAQMPTVHHPRRKETQKEPDTMKQAQLGPKDILFAGHFLKCSFASFLLGFFCIL